VDRLLGLGRLVRRQVGEESRYRAARLRERHQAHPVGGELVAGEARQELLQEPERAPRAEGLVVGRLFRQPDEGGGVAVGGGDQAVPPCFPP
jgi:hypothetical protein